MEHIHTCDICVGAVVEFERYFDGGCGVFAEREDIGRSYDDGRDVAADRLPGCVCGLACSGAPDGGWFGVPERAVCAACVFGDSETVEDWGCDVRQSSGV
jgi:hypothetical protein